MYRIQVFCERSIHLSVKLKRTETADQCINLLLHRLADCLFYLLLMAHLKTDSGVLAAFAHPELSRSMERIHRSENEKLSLDQLAKDAAMSRSAFAALFKEFVCQSPIEYIAQWRMTQAYRWLVDDGIGRGVSRL